MLPLSQTHWLSLIMIVEQIIEQWETLKFFTDKWLIEWLQVIEQIFKELTNPVTKPYFFILNRFYQSLRILIVSFKLTRQSSLNFTTE